MTAVAGVAGTILTLPSGCASTVPGIPAAAEQTAVTRSVPGDLTALLPAPEDFPSAYPAVVLPPEAAVQAVADLSGVPRGSTVFPAGCAPPEPGTGGDRTAAAVGTDDATRATLTVALTRSTRPLSELEAQQRACGEFAVQRAGTVTTVRTVVLDPPPVDADDTFAMRRVVRPDVGGVGLTQAVRTLAGQVDDVRITVTYMAFDGAPPDLAALDALFALAVQEVRQA